MEERQCYRNLDFDSPMNQELLRRFQNLSKKEKSCLLSSLCHSDRNGAENVETLDELLSLLSREGYGDIGKMENIQSALEEEAEEEEEEDEEDDGDDVETDDTNGDGRKYSPNSL